MFNWGIWGCFAIACLAGCAVGSPTVDNGAASCPDRFDACTRDKTTPIELSDGVYSCLQGGERSFCSQAVWCAALPKCTADSTGTCCP